MKIAQLFALAMSAPLETVKIHKIGIVNRKKITVGWLRCNQKLSGIIFSILILRQAENAVDRDDVRLFVIITIEIEVRNENV